MNQRPPLSGQLPHGVKDLFLDEAANLAAVEHALRQLLPTWGYTRIIPPTFEYYDSYAVGAGEDLRARMYRLFDRDGRTLALRPDLTIPIARIVGTKLYDQPLPLRFYYIENVFRFEEPQAGRQREFTQAGIELLGASTPEADAEVLKLAIHGLRTVGLTEFQISLGHLGFFRALITGLDLSDGEVARLRAAIDRRSVPTLQQVLDELDIAPEPQQALSALPRLVGGASILDDARALAFDNAACGALDHLSKLYHLLAQEGLAGHVTLDLGEVRGMDYYTGITFEGFVSGVGYAVCNGGRYDSLVSRYGPAVPAVGWGLALDRVLLARAHAGQARARTAPDALVVACDHPACRWLVDDFRRRGMRLEYDVLGRSREQLAAYARERRIPQILACTGPGELGVVDTAPDAAAHARKARRHTGYSVE